MLDKIRGPLSAGMATLLLMTLFPPWKISFHVGSSANRVDQEVSGPYSLITSPPPHDRLESVEIDLVRLAVQWVAAIFAVCLIWLFTEGARAGLAPNWVRKGLVWAPFTTLSAIIIPYPRRIPTPSEDLFVDGWAFFAVVHFIVALFFFFITRPRNASRVK